MENLGLHGDVSSLNEMRELLACAVKAIEYLTKKVDGLSQRKIENIYPVNSERHRYWLQDGDIRFIQSDKKHFHYYCRESVTKSGAITVSKESTVDGKTVYQTMENLEEELKQWLTPGRYIRCHRDYIVDIKAVLYAEKDDKGDGGQFIIRGNGQRVPYSNSYVSQLIACKLIERRSQKGNIPTSLPNIPISFPLTKAK